ncbi:hypothetical protein [Alienimonas chondri]|uniref:Uncharacterized protein n=1 Tax=Alienimonas chondri TaxID=2681879 RepID=A0ABX1VN29_9PLAN|nr:hypothetical protein [Alienimonas chondri]NNJ28058.1 hypothetical protein [Alienimonas chondri]
MTETNQLRPIKPRDLTAETNTFTTYLSQLGLPTDNVIATTDERDLVATNLPSFLESLSKEQLREARYLSKFVGATAIGLFDAALNYVWNEVVLNLRRKVAVYGIDLFFDAAVGGAARAHYKDESDLDGLKDSVLLDTCRKLELLSDIVYRKVDHILTMRNEVAASHPNVESIGGFELMGWLQTCVKDVLQDSPSESAIQIRSIVGNLRNATAVLDADTVKRFDAEVRNLSPPHVHNLLITLFGIYAEPNSDQVLRKNIAQLSPSIWECAEDRVRYRIGVMIDGYRTNLHEDKLKRGLEFLKNVEGLAYESLPARTVALDLLNNRLREAHSGWDNFYHEPPAMQEVLGYCKKSTDIPAEIMPSLVKTVITCRIGRGLSYKRGVSPAGCPLYDAFLGMLDDNGVIQALTALFSPEVNSKLQNPICQEHLGAVLQVLRRIAISERLQHTIDFLLNDIPNAYRANRNDDFRDLTRPVVNLRP